MKKWSDMSSIERGVAVRKGVAAGKSARQMADELGCSRYSIIGKCNREGLQIGGSGVGGSIGGVSVSKWAELSPPSRVETLRVRLEAGQDVHEIAKALGAQAWMIVSFCRERAVLARLLRRANKPRLAAAPKPSTPLEPEPKPTPLPPEAEPVAPLPRPASIPLQPTPGVGLPSVGEDGVHLFDLQSRHCRAPRWGNRDRCTVAQLRFCGAPVVAGLSYCREHAEAFGANVEAREREQRRIAKLMGEAHA